MRGARLGVVAGLIAATAVALAGCSGVAAPSSGSASGSGSASTSGFESGTPPTASADARADDERPLAVFVGDSIVNGMNLPDPDAWPEQLGVDRGWDVVNLGCDGGGFVALGSCRATVATRLDQALELDPDILFVVASRNDLGANQTAVTTAIGDTIRALGSAAPRARVVGVSAVWGPGTPPVELAAMDTVLRGGIVDIGGVFLAIEDPLRPGGALMQPDAVHPTRAGETAIAEAVGAALDTARVTPAPHVEDDGHEH